ncbi:hypothetical protein GCM10022410_02620 [Amphibacillus indicireducens]|uniref:ATP-binding cassette domain-containing protein n=2 Tax=Amphibacillus indicireducens TaxID=1076330 RepID=A0ABP7V3U4_9BACI
MSKYILEMHDISKTFPGVKALDEVNFKVEQGEIHCLVGENGAGKSTLMKVLSGVYPYGEYQGDIVYQGKVQQFNKINESVDAGIVIIYQELALFPDLPIYENIYINNEVRDKGIINWNQTIVKAREMLDKVNLKANPKTLIKDLGVGSRQLVEIAKAMSKNVKLLILDEPTAALNETDSENLLQLIKELKKQGITCIMISHKLQEIVDIADKATVLRDGKTICTLDAKKGEIDERTIIKHMVGRELNAIYPELPKKEIGDRVFELHNWSAYDSQLGRHVVKKADLHVNKGEIVGIAGLMGSGRTELALSIFGNQRNYKLTGDLVINGHKKDLKHTSEAIAEGIAYVTEGRKDNGLFLTQNITQNISVAKLAGISDRGIINKNEEIKVAEHYKKSLGIKASSIEQLVEKLSGGNQQKVSLGKWLFVGPKILILDEPTRGIDVGAKFEIYTVMNELIKQVGGVWIGALYGRQFPVIVFRDQQKSFRSQAIKIVQDAFKKRHQTIDQGWLIGIGDVYPSLDHVQKSYQEALIAMIDMDRTNHYRFYQDLPIGDNNCDRQLDKYRKQQFFDQVRLGEWDNISQKLTTLIQCYEKDQSPLETTQQKILELIWMISRLLDEMNIHLEWKSLKLYSETYQQFIEEIRLFLNRLKEKYQTYHQNLESDVIKQIKQYIIDHSSEEISLDLLADRVGLSTIYISKMFKEKLGINYIDFLTECRIEKAKELIQNPEKSIKEISYDVGYHDPNYFSKVFKKTTGISPMTFRERVLTNR